MKELSLNILDIAQNSVKAKAENILIKLIETDETLTLTIQDDGCGMSEELMRIALPMLFSIRISIGSSSNRTAAIGDASENAPVRRRRLVLVS